MPDKATLLEVNVPCRLRRYQGKLSRFLPRLPDIRDKGRARFAFPGLLSSYLCPFSCLFVLYLICCGCAKATTTIEACIITPATVLDDRSAQVLQGKKMCLMHARVQPRIDQSVAHVGAVDHSVWTLLRFCLCGAGHISMARPDSSSYSSSS